MTAAVQPADPNPDWSTTVDLGPDFLSCQCAFGEPAEVADATQRFVQVPRPVAGGGRSVRTALGLAKSIVDDTALGPTAISIERRNARGHCCPTPLVLALWLDSKFERLSSRRTANLRSGDQSSGIALVVKTDFGISASLSLRIRGGRPRQWQSSRGAQRSIARPTSAQPSALRVCAAARPVELNVDCQAMRPHGSPPSNGHQTPFSGRRVALQGPTTIGTEPRPSETRRFHVSTRPQETHAGLGATSQQTRDDRPAPE